MGEPTARATARMQSQGRLIQVGCPLLCLQPCGRMRWSQAHCLVCLWERTRPQLAAAWGPHSWVVPVIFVGEKSGQAEACLQLCLGADKMCHLLLQGGTSQNSLLLPCSRAQDQFTRCSVDGRHLTPHAHVLCPGGWRFPMAGGRVTLSPSQRTEMQEPDSHILTFMPPPGSDSLRPVGAPVGACGSQPGRGLFPHRGIQMMTG